MMVKIFFCSLQLVLLGAVILGMAYFMRKNAEDRDPMLALALNGFCLLLVVLYLIIATSLIGRWCI
jgi:hypothetical protein